MKNLWNDNIEAVAMTIGLTEENDNSSARYHTENDAFKHDQGHSLINGLMQPECYDHPVVELQLIETYISWVILTGHYAYKIKKPINLGFLDYLSLENRHFYCQQELRLNQRLTRELYLEVVTITGTSQSPQISGQGKVIEYAVKMIQFPQSVQLDRMLMQGAVTNFHIDAFAKLIATFHQNIDIADSAVGYGDPESLIKPVIENFTEIAEQLSDYRQLEKINKLKNWAVSTAGNLKSIFEQRKLQGFIRECHGDCHLRNMAWFKNKPLLFDCIEFDSNLRWIDVISEIAFLYMDLQKNQSHQLAHRFLNYYLEHTGDYAGVAVLPFYLSYRALVRAKVEAIQTAQEKCHSSQQVASNKASIMQYLQLAQGYCHTVKPKLIITCGFSACGKTTLSQKLLERLGAIRIRSDVERKRLFGIRAEDSGHSKIEHNIYSTLASQQTYTKLLELADGLLDSGFSVIIDAACLKPEQRKPFQDLAESKQIPYLILNITASADTLLQRIKQRDKGASDANYEILQHQLLTTKGIKQEEVSHVIQINTEKSLNVENLLKDIEKY